MKQGVGGLRGGGVTDGVLGAGICLSSLVVYYFTLFSFYPVFCFTSLPHAFALSSLPYLEYAHINIYVFNKNKKTIACEGKSIYIRGVTGSSPVSVGLVYTTSARLVLEGLNSEPFASTQGG